MDHAAQDSKQVQSARSTERETSLRKKTKCYEFTWKEFLCPANTTKEVFPCLIQSEDTLRKQISIYGCFQLFQFCLGQSMAIQDLQNLIPFIAVSLGCTKAIAEIFQIYSNTTENKALLLFSVNLVSYLLPLGLEWSLSSMGTQSWVYWTAFTNPPLIENEARLGPSSQKDTGSARLPSTFSHCSKYFIAVTNGFSEKEKGVLGLQVECFK